ncbi:MAG: M20/M25/M40 family metallo-hydrolase, partial [Calditrichaeota bacterium]
MKLNELKPERLWYYFEEICKIPRLSKHEGQMADYLVAFAEAHDLSYQIDSLKNIVIRKKGTPGFETRPIVVLQSHQDMVGEKNEGTPHDFYKDPIVPEIEDGWVKARGTTLGADDGIGMAAQLAILESSTLEHPPLECLFTVDEETGLTGAFGLSPDFIEGRILINLDSEDWPEIFIGCAGGRDTRAWFTFQPEKVPSQTRAFRILVSGLKGGHSGDEIHKGHGNAIKIL